MFFQLQLCFTVKLQNCSVDDNTSPDFISSGGGEEDFISSGGGEEDWMIFALFRCLNIPESIHRVCIFL